MRAARIFYNRIFAGVLEEENRQSYRFIYDSAYFSSPELPAISLTLPKTRVTYYSPYLFPFFYNMIAEGANRALQSRQLKIDEQDAFGFLLATAQFDTVGAITVTPIE